MPKKLIYVAGSMRNREGIKDVVTFLQHQGFDCFFDWVMPGEETDEKWQEFAQLMGQDYLEALKSPHAIDVFEFDKLWLNKADAFVLVYPAGKSGHTELGFMVGLGKPAYIYMPEVPSRWDLMVQFADGITDELSTLADWLWDALKVKVAEGDPIANAMHQALLSEAPVG